MLEFLNSFLEKFNYFLVPGTNVETVKILNINQN